MPPDYSTPVGQLRMLLGDTGEVYLFSDAQMQAYLALYHDNIKRAAGAALLTVAANQALLLKYVKTDDLTIDGPKVAAELRLQAAAWDSEGQADDALDDEFFMIAYPRSNNCDLDEYVEHAVPHFWWNV